MQFSQSFCFCDPVGPAKSHILFVGLGFVPQQPSCESAKGIELHTGIESSHAMFGSGNVQLIFPVQVPGQPLAVEQLTLTAASAFVLSTPKIPAANSKNKVVRITFLTISL
jgi:hypothetical protein